MSIAETFSRTACSYDGLRRILIPCFDAFYGAALECVNLPPSAALKILDLGAGTGLLGAFFRDRFPQADITLMDIADGMMAQARLRFSDATNADSVRFVMADYTTASLGGPYDVVASALSIHHLEADQKRDLFNRIFKSLRPGGRFINADQVEGETPSIDARYREIWVKQIHALGVTPEDYAAACDRMRYDRMSSLADQLQWLKNSGFRDVDCVYKSWNFVVYTGIR
ncbi:tRNA (cmo5U34)-methyltransferase [Azospirillaceae bacterium]